MGIASLAGKKGYCGLVQREGRDMRSILSNCQGAEVWREGLTGVVSEASKDTCPGALKVEFAESKLILLVLNC